MIASADQLVTAARRQEQFDRLAQAHTKVLDLTSWHEFFQCVTAAGFRSRKWPLLCVRRRRAVTLAGATLISAPARTVFWGSSPYAGRAPKASRNVALRLGQICARELRFQRDRQTDSLPH